jgi:hypothetical protein
VFTLIYGLQTTRRLLPIVAGIMFGVAVVSIDLVRRARELQAEGFSAADVRRAFGVERKAHAEEQRRLFDARRTAARRRTRRRAWITFAICVPLRVAAQLLVFRPGATAQPTALPIIVFVLLDLINTVSLVVALNTSPRTERRGFRLAAWIWQSGFTNAFFRVAGLGGGRPDPRPFEAERGAAGARLARLVPDSVASRFPGLSMMIERLETAQATERLRELEIGRALGEAGGSRTEAADARATSADALELRRNALLAEMRETLDTTRTRRATLAAALENVRIQLLRIGAGIGTAEDMREEVAVLTALAERPDSP